MDRVSIATRHRELLRRVRRTVRTPNPRAVVVSRILVFQSKLLLLSNAERTYQTTHDPDDLKRFDRIRGDLHRAEAELRRADVTGRPARASAYWLSVYSSLIDNTRASLANLEGACAALPGPERFEMATDVQMLEDLMEHWTQAKRTIEHYVSTRAANRAEPTQQLDHERHRRPRTLSS